MTDTATAPPTAGWYPDPSGRAPFRWWSGRGWTPETRQDPVKPSRGPERPAGGPPPTPASLARPRADSPLPGTRGAGPGTAPAVPPHPTPLPSRRSLRAPDAAEPTGRAAVTPAPAAPAPAATAPAAPAPAAPAQSAAPSVPTPQGGQAGFTPPAAWAANAPSTPTWSGAAAGSSAPFATETPFVGAGAAPTNAAARLSLTFALLVLAIHGLTTALANAGALASPGAKPVLLVVSVGALGLVIAGIPLGIVGLVRAARLVRFGHRARGRAMAIIGVILCSAIAAVFSMAFLIGVATGIERGLSGSPGRGITSSDQGAVGTPRGAAAGGTFSGAPQVATSSGDGTFAYSQTQAQNAISAAYVAALKVTPTGVSCPATESIQVSVNFACGVTLPGGTSTTAQVVIVDDQGHAEVTVH